MAGNLVFLSEIQGFKRLFAFNYLAKLGLFRITITDRRKYDLKKNGMNSC